MITLAFDTCLDVCSVALFDGAGILAARHESMARGHAEALLPSIDDAIRAASLEPSDIDRIAVTCGPGTFTGVRVGVAAARGLVLGSGLPIVGLTSLRAVALCAIAVDKPTVPVVALVDAGRGELYMEAFGPDGDALREPLIATGERVRDVIPPGEKILAGNAAEALVSDDPLAKLSAAPASPDARIWAPAASCLPVSSRRPLPLYLRAPDAKPQGPNSKVRRAAETAAR